VAIKKTGRTEKMRCIGTNDVNHTYLCKGFIPTHNTVVINTILAQEIAKGSLIAICDTPSKSGDFLWAKDFVQDKYWGCDGLQSTNDTLETVKAECERRAAYLKQKGAQDWEKYNKKYPQNPMRPLFFVLDEAMVMLTKTSKNVINSLPKDSPVRMELENENALKGQIYTLLKKIPAEYRFVGVRFLIATQVTTKAGAIEPDIRALVDFRLLQGAITSKSQRMGIFSDIEGVPVVPKHIQSDSDAARGVGVHEFAGIENGVYKGYYASVDDLRKMLVNKKVSGEL
jgi:hypothetical protein